MATPAGSHGGGRSAFTVGSTRGRPIALAVVATYTVAAARLTHCLRESRQIVLVGRRRRVTTLVPDEFPALRCGGRRRVNLAQIP